MTTDTKLLKLAERMEAFDRLREREEEARRRPEAPTPTAKKKPWPVMDPAAFQGLTGDIVRTIEPHTEADPVAVLLQILVAFGNALGAGPHCKVEADRHGLNLFVAIVGDTSSARKGTSWGYAKHLMGSADQGWLEKRVLGGLSSGEGLVWQVRDPTFEKRAVREKGKATGEFEWEQVDAGVEDKRLLVVESELSQVMKVMEREGNTLSPVMRQAWDGCKLGITTKNSPAKATGAHISIIGHITETELRRHLTETEYANGFANRFLWACVRRSKYLPEGGEFYENNLAPLVHRLHDALEAGRKSQRLKRDPAARESWHSVYQSLTDRPPGMFGAITARAAAQVMRLEALFAALDQSGLVRIEHHRAALAVWAYCEDSVRYIFGEMLGDPIADRILEGLRSEKRAFTKSEIFEWGCNNWKVAQVDAALMELEKRKQAFRSEGAPGSQGGRPKEMWSSYERNELNEKTPPDGGENGG